jgi:hypothetical protein
VTGRPLDPRGGRAGAVRALARSASALVWGALLDISEMLVVSLLTASAAAALACALASLVGWLLRAAWSVVARCPTQDAVRRSPCDGPDVATAGKRQCPRRGADGMIAG